MAYRGQFLTKKTSVVFLQGQGRRQPAAWDSTALPHRLPGLPRCLPLALRVLEPFGCERRAQDLAQRPVAHWRTATAWPLFAVPVVVDGLRVGGRQCALEDTGCPRDSPAVVATLFPLQPPLLSLSTRSEPRPV